MNLHLRGFDVERLAAVPGGGGVVCEGAVGEGVGGGGFAVAVFVMAALFAAGVLVGAAFRDGVQGVGGAVGHVEVVGACPGGDGVEAALEEVVVGAGKGEVLYIEISRVFGRGGGKKVRTAPRIPKPSSMLPQMAAQQ